MALRRCPAAPCSHESTRPECFAAMIRVPPGTPATTAFRLSSSRRSFRIQATRCGSSAAPGPVSFRVRTAGAPGHGRRWTMSRSTGSRTSPGTLRSCMPPRREASSAPTMAGLPGTRSTATSRHPRCLMPTSRLSLSIRASRRRYLVTTPNMGSFRSTNRGATWTRVTSGTIYDLLPGPVSTTMFMLGQGQIIGGFNKPVIYRTLNGGVSWTQLVNTELNTRFVRAPSDPRIVYVVGWDYISTFRTTNEFATFDGGVGSASDVAISPLQPNHLAIAGYGLTVSHDGGGQRMPHAAVPPVNSWSAGINSTGTLMYAGTDAGFFTVSSDACPITLRAAGNSLGPMGTVDIVGTGGEIQRRRLCGPDVRMVCRRGPRVRERPRRSPAHGTRNPDFRRRAESPYWEPRRIMSASAALASTSSNELAAARSVSRQRACRFQAQAAPRRSPCRPRRRRVRGRFPEIPRG